MKSKRPKRELVNLLFKAALVKSRQVCALICIETEPFFETQEDLTQFGCCADLCGVSFARNTSSPIG